MTSLVGLVNGFRNRNPAFKLSASWSVKAILAPCIAVHLEGPKNRQKMKTESAVSEF